MAESEQRRDVPRAEAPRRYAWRYGPLRLVMPWACVGFGVVMVVARTTLTHLWLGCGLVVLGVVAFFVFRWMAKRGL